MPTKKSELLYRSKFLLKVFEEYVSKGDSIIEIGAGDWRNVDYLKEHGYVDIMGIDKKEGTSVEDWTGNEFDVVFTMSTLFLIPPENEWVFKKIASAAKKYIITIEGETTDYSRDLWGRDYTKIFNEFGFEEVYKQDDVFNEYGVLRILKRCKTQTV